jgi:RecB family endonuclease NucS
MSEPGSTVLAMRLVVARCEVLYTGRLTARLPEAVRLLMFKADGSFLVHDDAGGFRPLNWIRSVFRPARVPRLVDAS